MAVITESGNPEEGQSYFLMCDVVGVQLLDIVDIEFQWDRDDSMNISQSANLTLSPLRRTDGVEYTCTATITYPLLTETLSISNTTTIKVSRKLITLLESQLATILCV